MKLRRTFLRQAATAAAGTTLGSLALPAAFAQGRKDTLVVGVTLEPPGLDPTAGAASAIAELTLYNIYETLTKIHENGSVSPLLAQSWTVSPDLKSYTFKLRTDAAFQNGEPFNAAAVKFSFERAVAAGSTNKDKAVFANFAAIDTPDAATVVLHLKQNNPNLLFQLGQATAAIVEPKSAPTNATQPVGTGPFKLDSWSKGASAVISKWPQYRNAAAIKLNKVTFRFISDQAASVAALLSGDVDAFPRGIAGRSLDPFKADPRFTVMIGTSRAKTLMAINNKRKPFDDVRVRRALAAAVDRKAVIDGAVEGLGVPIGSHYVPGDLGYVDTTGINPYDPDKARKLLAEAGVKTPLEVTLRLPPPPYARSAGEIIASELGKVGVRAKIENLEWAQWLSGVYKEKNYDLTIVSHVEPIDLDNYTKPDYYYQYDSQAFRDLYARIGATADEAERARLLGEAQKMLATDCVNVWLFAPQWPTVVNSGVKGFWKDMPIFCNDLSAVYWT